MNFGNKLLYSTSSTALNFIIADNIITPLAYGTENNLQAVLAGQSSLHKYDNRFTPAAPFCASMFNDITCIDGYTCFESQCIKAIQGLEPKFEESILSSSDTIFIISTTKGNIDKLQDILHNEQPEYYQNLNLNTSARKIAAFFGNAAPPIVVSNACISGVCAIITAQRLLETKRYRNAIVVGADMLSLFIVSGFQSFKALSPQPCRPFDAARTGLNLGEAAAAFCITSDNKYSNKSLGTIVAASIHNDANHISGPSRTGEGSYLCLKDVLPHNNTDIAFLNVHGTATAYNDEMEAIAICRAGLQDVPINALKGYYGHTLGAAGLLETIISLHALRQGLILPTKGYNEQGTTNQINISNQLRHTDKQQFVKLLSGFGGCNAAIRITTTKEQESGKHQKKSTPNISVEGNIDITPDNVVLNNKEIHVTAHGEQMLTELYRSHINDYPKFFKMDTLSRLGFIASELLLQSAKNKNIRPDKDCAVIFANASSCIKNDTDYQRTISDAKNYYPSPALFVYTLPNIVTGEIAIRNKYYGETSFYILEKEEQLTPIVEAAMANSNIHEALVGWLECKTADNFEAHLKLIKKNEYE